MKKKENRRPILSRFGKVAVAAYTVLLLVFCCAGVQFFFHWCKNIQKERRTHLLELTETLSELAEFYVSSRREMIQVTSTYIAGKEFETAEELFDALQEQNLFFRTEESEVYVICGDGTYFKSDRTTGVWRHMEYLSEHSTAEEVWIRPVPGEENRYLFCWIPLEEPVQLKEENRTLEYYTVIIGMSQLEEVLETDAYAEKSSVSILETDGTRLYCQNRMFDIPFGTEYLSELEKSTKRISGSWEKLREAVSGEPEEYCMEVSYQGVRYYLATCPVANIPNWKLMVAVESDALMVSGDGRNDYGTMLIWVLVIVLAALGSITAILLLYLRGKEGTSRQQRESARLFEQAAKEANRANRAKTELMAHISHDIRTPIGGVMGMTNIARRSIEDKEKVEDCLDKIEESSEYLLSLVNKVLELPQIENGELQLVKKPFSLPDMLTECVEMLEGQVKKNEIWFSKRFSSFVHPVLLGDRLHIQQILMNILGNAVKYTPVGGQVIFCVTEREHTDGVVELCFTVEDTGIGMEEEFLNRIYQPYVKADETMDRHYQGTGLGMTIAKQYIDAMEGTIQVESKPGVGSRFMVQISLEVAQELPVKEAEVTVTKAFQGKKILVAEDAPIQLRVTVFMLESMGFAVKTASNGSEAVEAFAGSAEGEYAAILMDVMMPEMDGLEATEAIRRLHRADAAVVPIIATTAGIFEEERTAILQAGMNGILSKPLNTEALYAEMVKWELSKPEL